MMLLFAALTSALASPMTYCVGGYNTCNAVANQHPRWHFHTSVIAPNGTCLSCFDEHDSSCETDFLANSPGWKKGGLFKACPNPNLPIRRHVIGGREATPQPPPVQPRPDPRPNPVPSAPEPPPPPPQVKYTPKITRVSAGPYAAGDEDTVYANVSGPGGTKGLKSGTILVTAGGQTARFAARPNADGSVTVKIKLPPSASSVSITFEPDPVAMDPGESLTSPRSASQTLQVATCPYRVTVAQPGTGVSAKVGAPLTLVPKVTATGQGGVPSNLQLTWTIVPADGTTIKLQSDAKAQATWNVPANLSDQNVSISVGGKADGQLACSAGERQLPISELGLGWKTEELPVNCSVDQVCKGSASLVLPDEPKARAAVEALLKDPGTKIAIITGSERKLVSPTPDGKYAFATTPTAEGSTWFQLEVIGPSGKPLAVDPYAVNVTPGLKLKLAPEIDFGTVAIGTPWHQVCKPLDYSGSISWETHSWKLEVQGAEGCAGEPVLMYANAWGQPSKASLLSAVETDPHDPMRPIHDICLNTWGCSGETSPDVKLIVTPLDPKFADQVATVKLKWVVDGKSWLWCWGWILVPIPFVIGFLLIVYGWFMPYRFPPHAAIRIASKPADLKRNAAITLRDLPGSGSGWYRHAKLGLHSSGEVNKAVSGAVVVLRAGKRDVLLDPSVPLEARDRRTGKYEPVQPLPHAAVPNTIYRAGPVYFRVEV